jgi:hypothetical protein
VVHPGVWYRKMGVVVTRFPSLYDPDIRSAEQRNEGDERRTWIEYLREHESYLSTHLPLVILLGVSRARTPYKVTRRWLTIAGVELCSGIHRRNSRCRDPFPYNPAINNRAKHRPQSFCIPLNTEAQARLVQSTAARTTHTRRARF